VCCQFCYTGDSPYSRWKAEFVGYSAPSAIR
jgi:hypothetical protein